MIHMLYELNSQPWETKMVTKIGQSPITEKIGNVIYHAISLQDHDEALIIKYDFPMISLPVRPSALCFAMTGFTGSSDFWIRVNL